MIKTKCTKIYNKVYEWSPTLFWTLFGIFVIACTFVPYLIVQYWSPIFGWDFVESNSFWYTYVMCLGSFSVGNWICPKTTPVINGITAIHILLTMTII